MPKETQHHGRHPEQDRKPPIITNSLFSMRSFDASKDLPIVYSPQYNIAALGIELMHQFDSQKYYKIAEYLDVLFLDTPFSRHKRHDETAEGTEKPARPRALRYLHPNRPISRQELAIHHDQQYIIDAHENKSMIAKIFEVWLINIIPQVTLETRLLNPIKWQVTGTLFATHLAMQHGWSINLGGGFHLASARSGETFCIFSDIFLSMKYVWRKHPLQKFMIIDLDAHQGLGLERDLLDLEQKRRSMVFLVDVFNGTIQPPDTRANQAADIRIELVRFTGDATYLKKVGNALDEAFTKFKPSLIFYIAGQDVLKNDQLGLMNLSDSGLKKRDELVFSWAIEKLKCPIVMLLGGGYLTRGAEVQAESIRNLFAKGLIWGGHRDGQRTLSRPRPGTLVTKSTHTHSHSSTLNKTVVLKESNPIAHANQPEPLLAATKGPVHAAPVASKAPSPITTSTDPPIADTSNLPETTQAPDSTAVKSNESQATKAVGKTQVIRVAPIESTLMRKKKREKEGNMKEKCDK